MVKLPNKDKLIKNFSCCTSLEEKYLYLIELGRKLPHLPDSMRIMDNLITDCQSKVWIFMVIDDKGRVILYGDSDAAIVKGLIATVFILYKGLTPSQILSNDINFFLKNLELSQHLTKYRYQGLEAIVSWIRTKAAEL